jgi:hypothetical protein
METHSTVITEAVVRLLRPLVRIMLRHGVSCGAFTELVRRIYVEVADREFTMEGRKQSVSRISVITGLNRKEVTRLRGLPPIEETGLNERYNRAARVISGWLRDERYHDKKGDPAPLPFDGERGFCELVKRYSGDMPPRAVSDELQRVGAVETTPHGELLLTARGYVPHGGDLEKLHVLGTDTRDLINTIDHNLTHPPEAARFQRNVRYDNVPLEYVEEYHHLAARLGQHVLEELDHWLAAHDRDSNPEIEGSGQTCLGLGIYTIEGRECEEDEGGTSPEEIK